MTASARIWTEERVLSEPANMTHDPTDNNREPSKWSGHDICTAHSLRAPYSVGFPAIPVKAHHLVKVFPQGKHRYYSLSGANVAAVLEALSVLAGRRRDPFVPPTPNRLRAARTCYDHIAGTLSVSLQDRLIVLGWLLPSSVGDNAYDLTREGLNAFEALGLDVAAIRRHRRRFAYACVDWSERRPHLAGALAPALLNFALDRQWLIRDLHSRALTITKVGRRQWAARFGLRANSGFPG